MTELFLNFVNMSISAGWIVLAVIILRLLLKKAPKWITVLLWGIVAFRLICPFSIESALSLIPSTQTINPEFVLNPVEIDSGVPIIDSVINPIISDATVTVQPEKDVNFFHIIMPYLAGLWLVGIFALLIYTVISYIRLKKKIGTAVLYKDNIFQSESVVSPFVLGIIKPKIYLPFNMNESDMEHVIAHEKAHIKRKDHLWKPLGFLLLAIYWFNPLIWVGYILLCKDIELACDEKVVKELDTEHRADYSQALLSCSVNRRMIAACPLAFGEVGVKGRIKTILNYKKPAFWIIIIAIIASIVAAVCFLTNPINSTDTVLNKLIKLEDYEVVEQDQKKITLAIPLSDLPDSIYSENGAEFKHNEIVAYKDATTSIYLTEARYSNEGNDNLYFCFDFDFDLPKKQGVLIYPYEITNNGLSGSVRTADSILTADNGDFSDAVKDRGQGSGNLIWFYVSTDALKQAQGTICFDVFLNEITYFLDGDDYSSASKQNVSEKLTWSYNPMLSHTSHYTRAFSFDCEYTHVDATCTGGEFWNLDTEGQPRDSEMRFEKGKTVYWTPSEAVIEKLPKKSEVSLTIFNNETQLHKCTIIFECVPRDLGTADFEIYFKESDGLSMVQSGDGILLFESSSISNVGGVDEPSNITTESLEKPPTLTVSCGDIGVNAWLGTYSWLYKNLENGTAQAINADSSHPLTRLNSVPTLSIVPSTLSHVEPRLAVLQFANTPDKIKVMCYSIDEKDTNNGEEISVKDMTFQMKEGKHLYEIVAEWTDTEESSGKAYYAFQTFESDMTMVYIDEPNTDTNLTTAISSVLNEKYKAEKPDGLIHIETYSLLAHQTSSGTPLVSNLGHMQEATVYLLVYHMKYSVNGGQLEEVEGDFVPTAITFKIDESGHYTLDEYWTPRTGADFEKDVKSKFPGASAEDVLNTEKYAENLIKENWRLAREKLN